MEVSPIVLSLSRQRWNVPVMACLHASGEATYVSLVDELAVSRDSLSRSLQALQVLRWVLPRERPPGYVLSKPGRRIAPPCADLLAAARTAKAEDLVLRRWTLPIAAALHGWSLRFAELKAVLADITPRALALALKDMETSGLVEREIIGGFPPSAAYTMTEKGARLLPALERLSKEN